MTIFVLTAMAAYGQNIYTKTLGSTSDKPIISSWRPRLQLCKF